MTWRDLFKTALSNLGRHTVRTALSSVGVMVGILTMVTMLSLGVGVQREMISNFQSLGLETLTLRPQYEERSLFNQFGEPRRTKLLTSTLADELRAHPEVIKVMPRIYLPGTMSISLRMDDHEVRIWVWDTDDENPTEPFASPAEAVAGRKIESDESGHITLSTSLLKEMDIDDDQALIGQEVELVLHAPRGETVAFPFTVVGAFNGRRGVRLGFSDQLALKSWWYNDPKLLETQGYDALTVRTTSLSAATRLLDDLEAQGFEVRSMKMMLDMANRGILIMQAMLGSVGLVALLVASLGIANTMIMAVYERTKEIGILKAVGAAPRQIRGLFIIEAALIGLIGGVAGTVGGWLLGLGLNWLIVAIMAWQEITIPQNIRFFALSWWLVALALAFATVVGLLAGLYPAARAARLDPLEALRHE
ncbi:MAG: ABC transporter permease [Anaerolineales bacterium]|nr:MAG: ABC transporter permease [Anaerolineales bacterium]